MSPKAVLISLVLALFVPGCFGTQSATGPDLSVEGRLGTLERQARDREADVLKLQAEVSTLQTQRQELRQLLEAARETITSLEKSGQPPKEKTFRFEPTRVELGFLTCAIDTDGKKGDDAIAAYVNICDQFDSVMKVAGFFRFDLFDLTRSKDHVIQSWSFKPEEAATHWQRFPGCYQFNLPFGGKLDTKKVVLKVTFTRPGNEEMTDTREVTVETP